MQAIKNKATMAEITLAKALWKRGHRYRKNNRKIFGNPDLTFSKSKLAIFVDGEFFHGYNWETEKHRIKTNRDFWWNKIEGNMRRDQLVNNTLKDSGWTILRFWTREIQKDLASCITSIEQKIEELCR